MLFGRLQPILHAAEETDEISPLGAVERVQLVPHEALEELRLVVAPELRIRGARQKVVEHLKFVRSTSADAAAGWDGS